MFFSHHYEAVHWRCSAADGDRSNPSPRRAIHARYRRTFYATCVSYDHHDADRLRSGTSRHRRHMGYISTSYIDMRMSMRRFTRLTNAFSKKFENHKAWVAFYFMWYNVSGIHQTLRVMPAMETGISDHVWSAEEIAWFAE